MQPDLKPCPFCGARNVGLSNTHTAFFSVECRECYGEISGESFSARNRRTRFHYAEEPEGEFEADLDHLWPEYKKAALSAAAAWNRRAEPEPPVTREDA